MAFYLVLPFVFYIIGYFVDKYNKDEEMRHTLKSVIPGIILFGLSGFRNITVGTDTRNYIGIFNLIQDYDMQTVLFEPIPLDYFSGKGYLFVNKFLSILIPHSQTIVIVSSMLIFIGITFFIYQYSKDALFSWYLFVTLYFLAYSFNIMRQYVAISLILVAVHFFFKKMKWSFVLIVLFTSFFFHSSALILLSLLIFDLFEINSKNMMVLLLSMLIATVIIYFNIEFFLNFIGRYQRYIGTQYFEQVQLGGTYLIWVAKFTVIVFLYFKFTRETSLIRQKEIYYSALFICASLCIEIIGSNLFILGRLAYYFDIFLIIIIPNLFSYYFKDYKYLKFIVMGLFFAYYIIMLRSNHSAIIPYRTIL